MSESGNERGQGIASLRNPWFTASVGITAAIAIVAAIAGFAWLPLAQQGERFHGVWDAICSAAGLVRTHLPARKSSAPITRRRASKSSRRCCRARARNRSGAAQHWLCAARCAMAPAA